MRHRQGTWARSSVLGLALVCLTVSSSAQEVAQAAMGAQAGAPRMLTIAILEGEGELNDVRARTAREPIVEVQDENHKPVAGALVLFAIHSSGAHPAASFTGIDHLAVRTGADGRAVGHGFQINKQTGNFTITVSATIGAVVAAAEIHETNISHGRGLSRTVQASSNRPPWPFWFEVGAVAAVATTFAIITRNPSSTTITPGTPTVGAP